MESNIDLAADSLRNNLNKIRKDFGTDAFKSMNESKYHIFGPVINKETGNEIPPDEPIFVLRAKDKNALLAIRTYRFLCDKHYQGAPPCEAHLAAIDQVIKGFEVWQGNNADKMKNPDSIEKKEDNSNG